jgi:hypothetical protein
MQQLSRRADKTTPASSANEPSAHRALKILNIHMGCVGTFLFKFHWRAQQLVRQRAGD